jgi:hypothetical protein
MKEFERERERTATEVPRILISVFDGAGWLFSGYVFSPGTKPLELGKRLVGLGAIKHIAKSSRGLTGNQPKLQKHYVGHCPLSEVQLIYTTFREFPLLPSSGDWLSLY